MKRLSSSDSLGGLISICPITTDEHNQGYPKEFQSLWEGLDEEGCLEETGHNEKKRRLSVNQVKALEKSFEVENKLEPERKVKLAKEVGLQPRQVAIWFQNRRARWKTRQLEKDYGVLKASFDSLKQNCDNLKQDNEGLLKEVRELKSKLNGGTSENKDVLDKEETIVSEQEDANEQVNSSSKNDEDAKDINFESFNSKNEEMDVSIFTYFKDGSSDSDSSAVLNEENINSSPNNPALSSSVVVQNRSLQNNFLISNGSSSSSAYQTEIVKIEEHNLFSGEDSCSTFFSDDQAPTLHWYTPEVWN